MMSSFMLVLFAVGFALVLSGCCLMHGGHGSHGGPSKAVCSVCGSTVKVKDTTPSMTWKGRRLYFASEEHLRRFAQAPDSFAQPASEAPASDEHGGHH